MDLKDQAQASTSEKGASAQTSSDPARMPTVEDYNLSPFQRTDKKTLQAMCITMLKCKRLPPGEAVQKMAEVLGLTLKLNTVPTLSGRPLIVISLVPTTPELTYAGYTYEEAANDMMHRLRLAFKAALNRAFPPQLCPPYA